MNEHLRAAEAVDQSVVRVANERAVLTIVASDPGTFGAEVARRCGLGPQTVSKILEKLRQEGLVEPGASLRGKRGQPATPYFLSPSGGFAIGCELGWRHCMVQLVNLGGEVLGMHRWEYQYPDASTVFAEVASLVELLRRIVPEAARSRILGVALAAPAAIADHVERLGGQRSDADLWIGVDTRRRIEDATGLATVSFNDGNTACWAELGMLSDPRPGSLAYFQISTAIPSAVVADGRLLDGARGNAGDLGMMLYPDQEGNLDSVASVAGLYALQVRLGKAGIDTPKGSPMEWDWGPLEPYVTEWIDAGSRAIAVTIVNTAAVIDSEFAIIDGVMPGPIVDRYIEGVRRYLAELPSSRPQTIARGQVGPAASSRGAAQLLLFRHFFSGDWEHFGV